MTLFILVLNLNVFTTFSIHVSQKHVHNYVHVHLNLNNVLHMYRFRAYIPNTQNNHILNNRYVSSQRFDNDLMCYHNYIYNFLF